MAMTPEGQAPRLHAAIAVATVCIPLLGSMLYFAWCGATTLTEVRQQVIAISDKMSLVGMARDTQIRMLNEGLSGQIVGLDRRVTTLEGLRAATDQQLAAMNAGMARLQQDVSDIRDLIRTDHGLSKGRNN